MPTSLEAVRYLAGELGRVGEDNHRSLVTSAADEIESLRARVAGLVAERQEDQSDIARLMSEKDELWKRARLAEVERDGLRARIKALYEELAGDNGTTRKSLVAVRLAAVLSDDGSRETSTTKEITDGD